MDYRALSPLPESRPKVGPDPGVGIYTGVEPDMHLLAELPLLILYLVDRTLGGQTPGCADAVPDISDQLLTLPYHGVVKKCRADLAEDLLTVPVQVEC